MTDNTKPGVANMTMTVQGLATYLRVHRATIDRLVKRGELPAFKVGSSWRFDHQLIDKWRLEAQTRAGADSRRAPKRTLTLTT